MWWNCVDASHTTRRQFINKKHADLLLDYMHSTYPKFKLDTLESITQNKIFFEMGGFGSYVGSQPRLTFSLPDSEITLDCADVDKWLNELKTTEKRTFCDGTKYVKVYSRTNCVILSIQEKEALQFQLQGKRQYAADETIRFRENMKAAYTIIDVGAISATFPTIQVNKLISVPKDTKTKKD